MQAKKSTFDNIQVVSLETERLVDVDKFVTIAALEYIVANNCLRQSKHRQSKAHVVILTTDNPPKSFQTFCQRCSLPSDCVIDGYSQWYPIESETESRADNTVHIANNMPDNSVVLHIANACVNKLKEVVRSPECDCIVVLDSLSSILRYSPGVKSFLLFRNELSNAVKLLKLGISSITIILTLRAEESGEALTASIRSLAETHVRLFQSDGLGFRSDVCMDVRRRKPSGRVVFENITARWDARARRLVDPVVKSGTRSIVSEPQPPCDDAKLTDLELAERGLTFRISLSSKEREMRAAAGLPYLHQNESLADTALELHPKSLQIGTDTSDVNNPEDGGVQESDEDGSDEDEELFSEDV